MDAFYERLTVRAATVDEILSDDFEALPGQKTDAELAARRLAAWCQASASGDWSLFGRRLERDGLTIAEVLSRLSTVRRKLSLSPPPWIADAIWIEAALQCTKTTAGPAAAPGEVEPCAFEQLFTALVAQAETRLYSDIGAAALQNLSESARWSLRGALDKELTDLCAPALYERFAATRKAAQTRTDDKTPHGDGTALYHQFVAAMQSGGFRALFGDKPVLLRLIAALTRQWIETSREFILRLAADLPAIRSELLAGAGGRVVAIACNFADPHNNGRAVKIVSFEDGARIVYKPKDLRLDVAWHGLLDGLNGASPPLALKAVRALARDGYGWTEFIEHGGCADAQGFDLFFRRAGAWLALLHCFCANDMHQENMIASGDHPVPIDLETILQATAQEHQSVEPEAQANEAAIEIVANSVMMIGLLPAYGRGPDNNVFAIGGMTADWNSRTRIAWTDINSDAMRPARAKETPATTPNLPHIGDRYARFADHIDAFIAGFTDYAAFLLQHSRDTGPDGLLAGFAGVPVRKVIRATRFYYMLLQRLKNHRSMDDGVVWSAQADFVARLADWEASDPYWPLQRAERAALLALNVPHFTAASDGDEIRDATGITIHTGAVSGLAHARVRLKNFDDRDIAWQVTVIGQSTSSLARPAPTPAPNRMLPATAKPVKEIFRAEADSIVAELARHAIRRGQSAAWIGLDWLGDSDVFQLACLGPDLYNGLSGIAVFLAAHAAVSGHEASAELARAALAFPRRNLKGANAARMARALGIGGATGLGSIVYAFAVIGKCLGDKALVADAEAAVRLFSDELIAADKQLDVMGGVAGAILALLRVHRDTGSGEALARAVKCGEHLLLQPRVGAEGSRCWRGQSSPAHGLNGMSHGAAGFAYALGALTAVSGREEFGAAAAECIAFEDASYDAGRHNWPDLRYDGAPAWPCQWCHGAPGIGLARIAMGKRGAAQPKAVVADIANALTGAEGGWPGALDTLCCGTLGNVEFFCEAADALGRSDLSEVAARRLTSLIEAAKAAGDYRWNSGDRQFNLGLFRGLAGVGYTALRRVDRSLANVLIWE